MYWWWQVKFKKRCSRHDLPQICKGSKYVCPVWIRPTDNLITRPRTSLSINKWWSIKYDTHTSTINKRTLERRSWRSLYIQQSNQLNLTSMNTQPPPSPRPSKNLRENQSHMSTLDTSNRQFSITPKEKFWDKWTLIKLMGENSSTINDANMITKTAKKILDK